MSLRLDDKHRYWVSNGQGEVRVPGVTEVIRHFIPAWRCDEFYLERGKAVHRAVELAIQDKLDWSSLDMRIVGRVRSILRFIKDTNLEVIEVEAQHYSERWGFAGTADLIAMGTTTTLCDWKGSIDPATSDLQVGAYSLLFPGAVLAAIVECRDDELYKVRWLDKRELKLAGNAFLNFLSVYNWQRQHGFIKENGE